MTVERYPQMSTGRLLDEAADWLVPAVERVLQARRSHVPESQVAVGKRAKVNDRLEGAFGKRPLPERRDARARDEPPPIQLDHRQVVRVAREHVRRPIAFDAAAPGSCEEILAAICTEWGVPDAVPPALAWLYADESELKGVPMNVKWLTVLIGVAAAAAVLALVLLARRNGAVAAQGREHRVSRDFAALQQVRDDGGPAAGIARSIIDSEASPWDFALPIAMKRLSSAEKRSLLAALSVLDFDVEPISPAPGEPFDPAEMSCGRVVDEGSRWVVSAAPSMGGVGFRLRGRLEVRAEVDACTADWWCLALIDNTCPIAVAVKADPDLYLGLDAEYAACWSVVQGFSAFADLRRVFDEVSLTSWSKRLRDALAPIYGSTTDRMPVSFGAEGDRYDASLMKAADGEPFANPRCARLGSAVAPWPQRRLMVTPLVGLNVGGGPPPFPHVDEEAGAQRWWCHPLRMRSGA